MSDTTARAGQYLTFRLGHEEYGVEILKVQEIKGYSAITPIPSAPAFLKGVMNLRGTIVPVVDLRSRFGMAAADYTPFTVIIVVTVGSRVMGLVVDAVSDVLAGPLDRHRLAEAARDADDEAELQLDVQPGRGLGDRLARAGWPHLTVGAADRRAADDDRSGAAVVADGEPAPVREQRVVVGPEQPAHVGRVLERRVEVDVVGDGEG